MSKGLTVSEVLGRLFIHSEVRAVVAAMDAHPDRWSPYWIDGELFSLTHETGVKVWCRNRPYGVDISSPTGAVVWGGVTVLSSLCCSPSHWSLSNAIGRWIKRASLADPRWSAAAALAREQGSEQSQ
jgi:hypothetical protein